MTQVQQLIGKLEHFAGKRLTMEEAERFASELTTRAARQVSFSLLGVGEEPTDGQAIASGITVRDFASRARHALKNANLLADVEARGLTEYEGAFGKESVAELREEVENETAYAIATLETK